MQDQVGQCETEGANAKKPICGEDAQQPIDITLSLAPLDTADMHLVRTWRNDYKIWQWCRQNDFISDYEQMKWFENQAKDPTIKMYKIVLGVKKDEKMDLIPIGVCGFTSINMTSRRAEFSLYIAPPYQGASLGDKSLSILLTHGFSNLGFNVIWGEVFDDNPALKIFEDLGFKREGLRRDFYFRDGKFIDAHLISIKASEWTS